MYLFIFRKTKNLRTHLCACLRRCLAEVYGCVVCVGRVALSAAQSGQASSIFLGAEWQIGCHKEGLIAACCYGRHRNKQCMCGDTVVGKSGRCHLTLSVWSCDSKPGGERQPLFNSQFTNSLIICISHWKQQIRCFQTSNWLSCSGLSRSANAPIMRLCDTIFWANGCWETENRTTADELSNRSQCLYSYMNILLNIIKINNMATGLLQSAGLSQFDVFLVIYLCNLRQCECAFVRVCLSACASVWSSCQSTPPA